MSIHYFTDMYTYEDREQTSSHRVAVTLKYTMPNEYFLNKLGIGTIGNNVPKIFPVSTRMSATQGVLKSGLIGISYLYFEINVFSNYNALIFLMKKIKKNLHAQNVQYVTKILIDQNTFIYYQIMFYQMQRLKEFNYCTFVCLYIN